MWDDLVAELARIARQKGATCVVVEATDLRAYFGAKTLKRTRIRQLVRAASSTFRYVVCAFDDPFQGSNPTLYLSTVPLPAIDKPPTARRVADVIDGAVRVTLTA